MKIKKHTLDARALAYVRTVLENGYALAEVVLAEVDLGRGRIHTYLPESMNESDLYEFRQGGFLTNSGGLVFGQKGRFRDMRMLIASELTSFPGDIFIFENFSARRGDRWLRQCRGQLAFYGQAAYHLAQGSRDSLDQISSAICAAEQLPFFWGLSASCKDASKFFTGDPIELDDTIAGILARSIEALIIGAYDGESYLLWRIE